MPRKDSPDTGPRNKRSPEPTEESNPSPELVCEGRDTSEIRVSSVDPTVQERKEHSGDQLDDPNSAASDELSGHSICSRCGGSKSNSDKGKTSPPTQPICQCDPELTESQSEEAEGLLQENPDTGDVSESAASDALSDDSICSRCGGSKRNRSTDLKPHQHLCKCNLKEEQDTESIPLREGPFAAVATEETSQVETFKEQNPDLSRNQPPPEREEPPEDDPNKGQRVNRQRRRTIDLEECLPECPDLSCAHARWDIVCVIVSMIGGIFLLLLYFLIQHALLRYASRQYNSTKKDRFE